MSHRCSTGKVSHPCRNGAEYAARMIGSNRLNVFQCGKCGGWHIGNSNSPFRIQKRLDQIFARDRKRAASVDTHPKDGDVKQAPLVSGAVPEGQTPNDHRDSSHD